jgi:hypothetical protein
MKVILIFIFLIGLSQGAFSEENEVLNAIKEAERQGEELYRYSESHPPSSLKELKLDKPIYKAFKKAQCRGYDYKYWIVPSLDGAEYIYGISQPKNGGVVIGRHLRMKISESMSKESLEPSTKTCLEIQEMKDKQNLLWATHLLSFTPSVFHIYESLNHQAELYISTEVALWGISAGKVALIKK